LKKRAICAALCALAVGLGSTGCSNTTWAMKSDNVTLPTGVYLYYLLNNVSQVYQNAEQASSSSASTSTSSAASADPWSQKIQNENASTWAISNAISSCKSLVMIEELSAQRKIALSASDEASAKSQADQTYSSYETMFQKNGISQDSVEHVEEDTALSQKLFDSYYGAKGDKAVPESTIDAYYIANYVHVKQIFVNKNDSTTNTALTGAKLTAATNKANQAYAAAKADVANFDSYVKKYNEDPGMTQNPDGYIFSKATASSQGFDQKFVDLAFSLKVGEVGMAESDMGYFIEYKVPVDPKASTFSGQSESVLSALKGDEFRTMVTDDANKAKIQQNGSLNKYDPKKMVLSQS